MKTIYQVVENANTVAEYVFDEFFSYAAAFNYCHQYLGGIESSGVEIREIEA